MRINRASWLILTFGLAWPVTSARSDEAIPAKILQRIKDATLYIVTEGSKGAGGSGSGFLIKTEGTAGYIVTNDHVVNLPSKLGTPRWTVVFRSGTKNERSVAAQVVGHDPAHDLAVLKVMNVPDLPVPFDLSRLAEPTETLPVYIIGFPLGEVLTFGRVKLSVTVTKGTISSVRRDRHDRVAALQVDASTLPGNSGGPVVDSQGRLVGIHAAHVNGTQIGLAIPAAELTALLGGRILDPFQVITRVAGKRQISVGLSARVVDPLGRLRGASLRVARSDALKDLPVPNEKGEWSALPNARKVSLSLDRQQATAEVPLVSPLSGETEAIYFIQAAYVDSAGTTRYTAADAYTINVMMPGALAHVTEGPNAADPLISNRAAEPPTPPGGGAGAPQEGGGDFISLPGTKRPMSSAERARLRMEESRKRMDDLRNRMRRRTGGAR